MTKPQFVAGGVIPPAAPASEPYALLHPLHVSPKRPPGARSQDILRAIREKFGISVADLRGPDVTMAREGDE